MSKLIFAALGQVVEDPEPSTQLFLQIGPTLTLLGRIHKDLPAAFYQVFTTSLWRWMRVYDFHDAEQYAEDEIKILDEEELKESFSAQGERRPPCLSA